MEGQGPQSPLRIPQPARFTSTLNSYFRTTDGKRIDPLTVQDAASRYLLACSGLTRPPFASVGLGSLTALSVWWLKLGITPERIEPGHPEQDGRLERFHRTLDEETANPLQATPKRQQKAFDAFRHGYNEQRPHEALGQQPPSRVYRPSCREYPRRVLSPEYGSGVTVRKVRTNGQIKWKGDLVYLSEALKGEPVGLAQHNARYWTILYGPLSIGLCWMNTPVRYCIHLPKCYPCARSHNGGVAWA